MAIQYTPHTVPLGLATVLATVGTLVAWQRRTGSLELWGTIVQFWIALWGLTTLLLVSSTTFDMKYLCLRLFLPIAVFCTASFFVFTVQFVGRSEWLTRPRLALLFVVPVASALVSLTNPLHGQLFEDPELVTGGAYVEIDYGLGVAFYVVFTLSYVYNVAYLGLLLQKFRRSRNVYRKMSLVLFVSLFSLSAGPVLFVLGYSPFDHMMSFLYTYLVVGALLILGTSSVKFLRALPIDRLLTSLRFGSRRTMATARDVVVQEIDSGIVILNTDGVVVDINSTARKMIGADRPVGKHISDVVSYERIQSDSIVTEILDGRRETAEFTDELWVDTPGGDRCYEVEVTALTDSRGRDAGHVILLHDITRQKRREETLRERETELTQQKRELEKQKTQLEHQNERLDRFASIVSHDLRNPLNVAKGQAQIVRNALEAADDPPVDPGRVEKAEESLGRMEDIIADALTLAREGKAVTEMEELQLRDTVESAWANVDTAAATLELSGDARIRGDRNRLLSVFENLFRNAVEHSSTNRQPQADDAVEHGSTSPDSQARQDAVEHGDGGVTVRVGLLDGGFYVEDDGPGVDDGAKDRVFEQGFTTSSEGTGFGLAIVRDVVRAHGWDVSLTDGSDGGARFEITGVEFCQEPTPTDASR